MNLFPVATLSMLAGLMASPVQAQQKVVPAQSEIGFVSRQMGVPVDGKFRKFDAQVAFYPKQPAAAKIGFTIDLASGSSAILKSSKLSHILFQRSSSTFIKPLR